MVRRRQAWENAGAQAITRARMPESFVAQHVSPLFYSYVERPPQGKHEQFNTDRNFWAHASSKIFCSVSLRNFRLINWFPRVPGVFWSPRGRRARELTWSSQTQMDPELGRIFNPESKMSLIEQGGIGTIRLRPRRIADTDCWLATALTSKECAGGVPLAIPDTFIRQSKVGWGDTVTIHGKVRLLNDAGLDDTAAYVHHASPVIIFVDKIEPSAPENRRSNPIILTPVAMFEKPMIEYNSNFDTEQFGYTFAQCSLNLKKENFQLDDAAVWLERYAQKHDGRIVTNFDEISPSLADAPLSYQRLITKKYDREFVKNLCGDRKLVNYIDKSVTNYSNFGQVGSMGDSAFSSENRFSQSSRTAAPNRKKSVGTRNEL